MERAAQLGVVAVVLLELAAAVQAGVVVRLDRVGVGPHHEERQVADVVDERVADVRDVLLAAGHLPHPLPDLLLLQLVEVAADVARARDVRRAEELVALPAQDDRHVLRPAVGVEQVLVGHAGGAGRAWGRLGHRHCVISSCGMAPSRLSASAACWKRFGSSLPPIQRQRWGSACLRSPDSHVPVLVEHADGAVRRRRRAPCRRPGGRRSPPTADG